MTKVLLTLLVIGLTSMTANAGITGLKKFDCNIRTEQGFVERANPIGRAFYAESSAQATGLYLASINLNVMNDGVEVQSVFDGKLVQGKLEQVTCVEFK